MNYLIQYKTSKKYVVLSNSTKDLSKHVGKSTLLSHGKDFFRVVQEIEIR